MSRVLAEYGKTKYVSLIFLIYHIRVSSPLFHFSLSQSAYTWWFGSGEASHNGAAGAAPLQQSITNLPSSTRARRAGRRSRRARRARASAGSASRAELEGGESWCKRHALKRGFGSDEAFPDGLQVRAPAKTYPRLILNFSRFRSRTLVFAYSV